MSRPGRTYRFAGFTFDPVTGDLLGPEGRDRLRPQAARVLEMLLARAGGLVTRDELHERVWPDTIVEFDQGLNACVKEIRQALGDSATDPRFVETLPRRGYRFVADVEVEAESEPSGGDARAEGEDPSDASPGRTLRRRLPLTVLGTAVVAVAAIALLRPGAVDRSAEEAGTVRVPETSAPGTGAPDGGGRERLMVLPVASPGSDPALDTLADVLTDRLIGDLSRLAPARLGVIARTSAMRYRVGAPSVAELGRRLELDYVVEGSVMAGPEPSLQLRLVDARDETQIWAGRYPIPAGGVAAIADRAGGEVARTVAPSLGEAHEHLVVGRAGDSGARDALARARYLLGLHTMDDTRRAEILVREGLESAPAHPGLLEALSTIHLRLRRPDSARATARRALTAQPASAEAHRVLALLAQRRMAWDTALTHYERAVALAPADPETRNYLAAFHNYFGRGDEAVRQIDAALSLDPVSATIVADAGVVYLWAGRYEEAVVHCRAALELRPDMGAALRCLIQAAWLLGRPEEGAPAAKRLLELQGVESEGLSDDSVLSRYWDYYEREASGSCAAVSRARAAVVAGRVDDAARFVASLAPDADACLLRVAGDPMFRAVRDRNEVRLRLQELGLR